MDPDHKLTLKYDQSEVYWCPQHDIIGVISHVSHLVQFYRIEHELETVVSEELNSPPSALEFAKHGRYFAVGDTHGRISLLKTDTLDEITSCVIDGSEGGISCLSWQYLDDSQAQSQGKNDPLDFDIHLKQLAALHPIKLEKQVKDILSLQDDCNRPPSLLVAADSQATIQVMYNGNLPVA